MAIQKLCDLCNCAVKKDFVSLSMIGKIQLYKGEPPPPPEGFEYQTQETGPKTFMKYWDAYGNVIREVKLVGKPPKHREVCIRYDLCEKCAEKFGAMLEHLRRQYHLEKKEIEYLDKQYWPNPFKMLGFDDGDKWKRGYEEEDEEE